MALGAPDKYCKLQTTFLAPIFIGTVKKRAPVSNFLRSYLAPRLKVKIHNLKVFQAHLYCNYIFTAKLKQLHLFSNSFHQINYNHIIVLSFPLPKDPSLNYRYKKTILRLKSISFLRFSIHKFSSFLLGIA